MSKKKKKHGVLWWLFIGWWWYPVKWVYYSIPAFFIRKALKSLTTPKPPKAQNADPVPPNTSNIKTYHATGMEHYLDNLLSLGIKNEDFEKSKKALIDEGLVEERVWEYEFYPLKVELVPEPDNPYDSKAIKVVVDGAHVAYIKKGSCAHLLKVIQEERIEGIKCQIGGGRYKYISGEWDDEMENVTYTLESDSRPYFVWLYITEKP